MKFVDNANLTTLLLGYPVYCNVLEDNGQLLYQFNLFAPTVGQLFCDQKIQIVLGLLNTPLDKLQQQFPFVANFSYYTLLTSFKLLENHMPVLSRYLEYTIYTFNIFGIQLRVDKDLYLDNQKIDANIFDHIRNLILFLSKIKGKNDSVFEQDPRYKASQDVIARIKNQNQNKTDTDNDNNFKKNFIVLLWEFGLTPEEIQKLNIFQYETILSYTSSAVSTKIGTVAAGNGLTKKFKYITEGGRKNGQ